MKIQTTAQIKSLSIDSQSCDLNQSQIIDLEFSAIDTGGGYKDPILDFSFSIKTSNIADVDEKKGPITLTMKDPDKTNSEVTFSHESVLKAKDDHQFEVNGRLKDDQLSRELIGFVLQLLR